VFYRDRFAQSSIGYQSLGCDINNLVIFSLFLKNSVNRVLGQLSSSDAINAYIQRDMPQAHRKKNYSVGVMRENKAYLEGKPAEKS
jgi:molybdopterin biosynthesis enzyme